MISLPFSEPIDMLIKGSSGNSNTGTLNDGASFTNGKFGKGVQLDGSNDDISVLDFSY